MRRAEFIAKLTELLLTIEQGMLAFQEPLPHDVAKHLVIAAAALGEEILPNLHEIMSEDTYKNTSHIGRGHIIDVVGQIGHPSSVKYLIDFRQNVSGDMTSAAVLSALRKIGMLECYEYFSNLIEEYLAGNKQVIESSLDLHIACYAMQDWSDDRGLQILKKATVINDVHQMPEIAVRSIATYPNSRRYLQELAVEQPDLKSLIDNLLSDMID